MPFQQPLEVIGPSVLHLVASSTSTDTDWIVKLSDVTPEGKVIDLTQGWLRASHRALDESRSTLRRPVHQHMKLELLVPGQETHFTIAILPIAHRFNKDHLIRLTITSDDKNGFAMQGQSHASLGGHARNQIYAISRLNLPIMR